jgi:molybdopterin synthase sulfur carrier subunit
MITVKFFASLREILDCEQIIVDGSRVETIEDIISEVKAKFPHWTQMTDNTQVLCALNHAIVASSSSVSDGDEVALFPPVTGG